MYPKHANKTEPQALACAMMHRRSVDVLLECLNKSTCEIANVQCHTVTLSEKNVLAKQSHLAALLYARSGVWPAWAISPSIRTGT
jgi:hypothetical protein